MKNIIVSLTISAIMIISIYYSINYLNKVSQDLNRLNEDLEEQIIDDNWELAYKTSMVLIHKWKEYSKKMKLFSNHQEIDTIEIELWKLPQYIKEMTKDEALASVHVLKFLLNHIAELEKIKFENIF